MQLLNMFNIGSGPTVLKWVVELAHSGLELAGSNANPAKIWRVGTGPLHH